MNNLSLEDEKTIQLKNISFIAATRYVPALFLLFILADIIYYPQHQKKFFIVRLLTIAIALMSAFVCKKVKSRSHVQLAATFLIQSCSISLIYMLAVIGDSSTPYYAGLNLVIIAMNLGFRFDWKYYYLNIFLIIAPLALFILAEGPRDPKDFHLLNLLFAIGTALISTINKITNGKVLKREYESRNNLKEEIKNRDEIIIQNTNRQVQLKTLAQQFSPQVVKQIEQLEVGDDLSAIINKPICVMFVDIVQSTERINSLKPNDFSTCIEHFIETSSNIFLSNELTIDKFLGDGFLTFSNAPFDVDNYVIKVVKAAHELLASIQNDQPFYLKHWHDAFSIRIGIDVGPANVGFVGSQNSFKTYTALGVPINLASRLCSAARNNHAFLSHNVYEIARKSNSFKVPFMKSEHSIHLKGFNASDISVYSFTYADDLSDLSDLDDLNDLNEAVQYPIQNTVKN